MYVVFAVFRILAVIGLIFSFIASASAQLQRPISGVVAATSGKIEINYIAPYGEAIGRFAGIGDPIYLNDEIITGLTRLLQVLLKDQTVFTIGPNAILVFDEFIYDPSSDEAGSSASLLKKGRLNLFQERLVKNLVRQ